MVRVLGVDLAVHDSDPSGAKPAVFCLHAIGHGSSDFDAFRAAFAERYRVVAVDWPGHGASGPDTHAADAQRYTALFTALVEQLDAKPLIVLGNSMGGAVAIRYAAAKPQQVRALILSNTGGMDENPGGFVPKLFIGHIAKKMRQGADGSPRFKQWFQDFYADILITPAARRQREAIVDSGYEVAPLLAQAWESFGREDSDVRGAAQSLGMPVLVAWAAQDKLIRWSRNREAVERIPKVEVHHFEAGHAPFLETPESFNAVAAQFLTKHRL
jgi:pimeloyl-ACP methyl ester carboxylesterase